jgi:hypothetical protein
MDTDLIRLSQKKARRVCAFLKHPKNFIKINDFIISSVMDGYMSFRIHIPPNSIVDSILCCVMPYGDEIHGEQVLRLILTKDFYHENGTKSDQYLIHNKLGYEAADRVFASEFDVLDELIFLRKYFRKYCTYNLKIQQNYNMHKSNSVQHNINKKNKSQYPKEAADIEDDVKQDYDYDYYNNYDNKKKTNDNKKKTNDGFTIVKHKNRNNYNYI